LHIGFTSSYSKAKPQVDNLHKLVSSVHLCKPI